MGENWHLKNALGKKILGYGRSNLLPGRWVGSGFLNTLLMIAWRENFEGLGLSNCLT